MKWNKHIIEKLKIMTSKSLTSLRKDRKKRKEKKREGTNNIRKEKGHIIIDTLEDNKVIPWKTLDSKFESLDKTDKFPEG